MRKKQNSGNKNGTLQSDKEQHSLGEKEEIKTKTENQCKRKHKYEKRNVYGLTYILTSWYEWILFFFQLSGWNEASLRLWNLSEKVAHEKQNANGVQLQFPEGHLHQMKSFNLLLKQIIFSRYNFREKI